MQILILFMIAGKYHTIDPLILETLNLNETRMNQILDILHGKPPKQHSPTPRKYINRSYAKESSQPSISQNEESLPPILLNRRKIKKEPTTARLEPQSHKKLQQDKSK